MTAASTAECILAAILFEGPLGPDHVLWVDDQRQLTFGRDPACDVPIGHAPFQDTWVSRRAGLLMVDEHRRFTVENCGQYSFEVQANGAPLQRVPPEAKWGPPPVDFTIILPGFQSHELCVKLAPNLSPARARTAPSGSPATKSRPPLATEQREVLDAYLAPILAGEPMPASHDQAASALNVSKSSARRRCRDLRAHLRLHGLPIPDHLDDPLAVTDAALSFHL